MATLTSPPLFDELLVRMCQGYNKLFRFRRRAHAGAVYFHELRLRDERRAYLEAARFELEKTDRFLQRFASPPVLGGQRVLDLGCRHGGSSVRYATLGAASVVGLDIREDFFPPGRALAQELEVADRVEFRVSSDRNLPLESRSIDVALAEDVLEHLSVPEAILGELARVLVPGGRLYTRFGPLWFHPHGVHLWEIFPAPWTHLLFPERIVCEVRRRQKRIDRRGQRYADLGLNQMSVRRFHRLVRESGLEVEQLKVAGIGGSRMLPHLPMVGELFSSELEAVLRRPLDP